MCHTELVWMHSGYSVSYFGSSWSPWKRDKLLQGCSQRLHPPVCSDTHTGPCSWPCGTSWGSHGPLPELPHPFGGQPIPQVWQPQHSARCHVQAQADNKRICVLCRPDLFDTTALVGVWLGCELLPRHIYCLTSVAVSLELLGKQREEQFSEYLVLRGCRATIQHKHSIYLKCRPTAASRLALMPLECLIQISNLVSGCILNHLFVVEISFLWRLCL